MDNNTLIGLLRWGARNTAFNLEFIPDDRLDWRPAPEALSALGIINHVVESLNAMRPILEEGEWTPAPACASTRDEAQALLQEAAEAYETALRKVERRDLVRTVKAGRRQVEVPLARASAMPIVDLIHHHGQIAYIQTLLGDTEFHFAPD